MASGGMPPRQKMINMMYLVLTALLIVVQVLDKANMLFALYGVVVGWVYLRFYQIRNGARGDPTESFGFQDFFPVAVQ